MKILRRMIGILLLATAVVTLSACREPEPETPPPEEILSGAAETMTTLSGFHFTIERSGAPAYVDADGLISFRRAEGDFTAPDRAQADVVVTLPGLVTQVSVVSIGPIQWQTNPLTQQWEELPPDWGFNPAALFSEEIGLPVILAEDMTGLTLAGRETLEGQGDTSFYRLTGEVAGDRLFEMSEGLIGPEAVAVELWVAPHTGHLQRVIVTEPEADSEEPSVWLVNFSQFGMAVDIEPPV